MGFREEAQKYYDLGFSIMPIKKWDKKPMLAWEQYQTVRVTQKELDAWKDRYTDDNIAIITGKVSNLVVVDIDGPEGMDAIKKKHMPPTLIAETGKGVHYYFKMPPDRVIGNSVRILPQVDIRGEGGYVVAPGSTHQSGKLYKWMVEADVADCPFWVYEEAKKDKERGRAKTSDWLENIKRGVSEGGRNEACAKLTGYYVSKSYEPADIDDLMLAWNRKNQPPMPEKEVLTTVKSILAKDPSVNPKLDVNPMPLMEAKKVLNKWLYYKDDNIVDMALAVVASNAHRSDPLWVIIVGASSSGKTEILRALDNHPDTYFIDSITPATFVTGFTKAKGILERMGPEPKTFVLQDLSTVISKPPYDRMQILDNLRQIYNGKYYCEWGNGKKFAWNGKVSVIAACTPDIENHSIAMGELGERFLYYRVEADDDDTRTKMMAKAREMEGKEHIARKEIAEAIHGVINSVQGKEVGSITMDKSYCDWLEAMVDMTTMLRSPVKRNHYRREIIEYTPHKEGPGRMYKACRVLMKSLAMVRGKTAIDENDYELVVKVCLDSIPSVRREAMRALIKISHMGGGGVKAKDVAKMTGYQSTESIGYHLADLAALGVVDRWIKDKSEEGGLAAAGTNAPWLYELTERSVKRLTECGMKDIL